jgi:hypothetical protein
MASNLFASRISFLFESITQLNALTKCIDTNNCDKDKKLEVVRKIEIEKKKLEKKNNNYDTILHNFLESKHQIGLIESKLKIKQDPDHNQIRIRVVIGNLIYYILLHCRKKTYT